MCGEMCQNLTHERRDVMIEKFLSAALELLAGAAVAVLTAVCICGRRKHKRCKKINNIFY